MTREPRTLEQHVDPRPTFGQPITPGEIRVLRAYLEAGSTKNAAHLLGIAESTVKNTMQNVRSKLNARTTAEAVFILHDRLAA